MEKKPTTFKSTEFVGHPVATGLITSGTVLLYTMPAGMGPKIALAAGLGLVFAGAAIQVTYNLGRVGVKKAGSQDLTGALTAAMGQVLPMLAGVKPEKPEKEKGDA